MKTRSRRKVKEEAELSAEDLQEMARRAEEGLNGAINDVLRAVEEMRREGHSHDAEIARLGEETRRLIAEMMHDLNLRAA